MKEELTLIDDFNLKEETKNTFKLNVESQEEFELLDELINNEENNE